MALTSGDEAGEGRREVGHAAAPDGALGAGVTHVDGAQAALRVGKVAPGVVSNHEALVGSHAELAAELLVVAGPWLGSRAVLGAGDEGKVVLVKARPVQARETTGLVASAQTSPRS